MPLTATAPPTASPERVDADPVESTDAAPTAPAAPAAPAAPVDLNDTTAERDYARKVALAWAIGIVAWTVLVTGIVLLAGAADDIGVGGAIVVGLCSGFWLAPLAGVIGVGRWASRWQH